jgi:hypothetical protein
MAYGVLEYIAMKENNPQVGYCRNENVQSSLRNFKNTVEAMNAELGINVAVYKAEPLKGKICFICPWA